MLNLLHGDTVNPVSLCQNSLEHLASKFANFTHLLLRELAGVYLRAFPLPILRNFISRVIRAGAEKQVIGANAVTHVALVQDAQTSGHRPVVKRPRQAVCEHRLRFGATVIGQPAITVSVERTSPIPAGVGLGDVRPKAGVPRKSLFIAPVFVAACAVTAVGAWMNGLEFSSAIRTFVLRHSKRLLSMFQGLTGLIPGASRFFTLPFLTLNESYFYVSLLS
jgi:hypothetical protein